MGPPNSAAPLGWVRKRDGRLVPFEPDKISRALFRATETLGRPDAFLAHELTDGILHFLAADAEGGIVPSDQIAETAAKVVRELGQPALAQAYTNFTRQEPVEPQPVAGEATGVSWEEVVRVTEGGPAGMVRRRLAEAALRNYSLRSVFTADLVAAHHEGLLVLGDLETPLELARAVLAPGPGGVAEQIIAASRYVGELLAIDSPEHGLATGPATYVRELRLGLEAVGLDAVVNLNAATPPTWAEALAEGPLFAERSAVDAEKQAAVCDRVFDLLLAPRADAATAWRVDWHLAEHDFLPENVGRLHRIVRRALDGAPLAFTFDRPRRRVGLAEGLDRQHHATLLTVGLNLPRLAERRNVGDDRAEFLNKLGSLVRMALSAGCEKRDFLRRQAAERPVLTEGFRLDRARLVLVPIGLDFLARKLVKCGLARGNAGAEFGRDVIRRIRDVVRQDSQSRHLDACLDGPSSFSLTGPLEDVAGLTAWDGEAPAKQQLRGADRLHAAAEMGTAALIIPGGGSASVEDIVSLLHHAWQKTDVVRVRIVRSGAESHQLQLASVEA